MLRLPHPPKTSCSLCPNILSPLLSRDYPLPMKDCENRGLQAGNPSVLLSASTSFSSHIHSSDSPSHPEGSEEQDSHSAPPTHPTPQTETLCAQGKPCLSNHTCDYRHRSGALSEYLLALPPAPESHSISPSIVYLDFHAFLHHWLFSP